MAATAHSEPEVRGPFPAIGGGQFRMVEGPGGIAKVCSLSMGLHLVQRCGPDRLPLNDEMLGTISVEEDLGSALRVASEACS